MYLYKKIKILLEDVSDIEAATNTGTHQNVLKKLAKHPNPDVVHAVASNPVAPPETLEELHAAYPLSDPDKPLHPVQQALIKNPNITHKIVSGFLNKGHEGVLDNDAMPMLGLEDPNTLKNMLGNKYSIGLLSMAGSSKNPTLLSALAEHPAQYVQLAALENPHLPPQTLQNFFTRAGLDDVESISTMEKVPKEAISNLINKIKDFGATANSAPAVYPYVSNLLTSKNLTPEHLESLRPYINTSEKLMNSAMQHKNVPHSIVNDAISSLPDPQDGLVHSERNFIANILDRSDVTPEQYERLKPYIARQKDLHMIALNNRKTPTSILDALSNSDENYNGLLQHPNTSKETLHKIAKKIIEHPELSEVLHRFKRRFYEHPNIAPETERMINNHLKNQR